MLGHCITSGRRIACAGGCSPADIEARTNQFTPYYKFLLGQDSPGTDIGPACQVPNFKAVNITDVANKCLELEDCLGFNTEWCLKNQLQLRNWNYVDPCGGIYVKGAGRQPAAAVTGV
jgi:hypothetical protein